MSYSFPKDAKEGDKVTLENGVEYIFHKDKARWVVNSVTDSLGAELATQEDIKRLQSEIVELEEEIDAIAPSVERGTWTFNLGGAHDESQGAAQYWVIDVEFVRSLSASSKADNADDVRVKIIQPPSAEGESGGDGNDHLSIKYNMKIAFISYTEEVHTMVANPNESKWSNSSFGGHGAEVFKDLYKWFPPEEYEFIPGDIIWFELEVSGGRAWEVQPPHAVFSFHATNVIEFTSARQHFQGHSSWAGFGVNDQQPDRSKTHQVIFQCFRRRG